MRKQLFTAVDISDLINMLAMFDLDKKLDKYLSGVEKGVSKNTFEKELAEFCVNLAGRGSATCGSISHPIF